MADLIMFNGKLHTQDRAYPQASAIAVRGGRILAVGSDDEIKELARPHSRLVDLGGRRVLPGLSDAHFHYYDWALLQDTLKLEHTRSREEVLQMVRQRAAALEPGTWIKGQGWTQTDWPDPSLPTRAQLDEVAPNNPVILWRADLHLAWVNSRALELAHISAATQDPDMGVIDREADGRPAGILRELAINLVRQVLPVPGDREVDEAMAAAMPQLHALGLTGVHDFRIMGGEDGPPALRAWQRLHRDGRLGLRAWVMLPGELLDEAIALGLYTGFGDDYLRLGGIKLFADGSLGARTAWMLAPFEDGGTGMPLTSMEVIADKVSRAHRAGISTGIHAIGDRAIRELLDVYKEVLAQPAPRAPLAPHRIEHVQHSNPEDLARLAPLGLVASVQPVHMAEDMRMVDAGIGERARWTYAFRTLLDHGTVLALGSDCPVASPNPFWGMHAALTRRQRDGQPVGGWTPGERISIEEAVWGYTMGNAIVTGQQEAQGSLIPGKLADLVVLERDILDIPADEILDTQVHMTVFDGKLVYERE